MISDVAEAELAMELEILSAGSDLPPCAVAALDGGIETVEYLRWLQCQLEKIVEGC